MKRQPPYNFIIAVLVIIIVLQWLFISRKPKEIPKMPVEIKGKIAIVIDDWGYNLNNLHIAEKIKYPLTASILPNLSYSSEVAEQLHGHGFEIILHLPMEPHETYRLEKNTISASLGQFRIRSIIEQDLANVKFAKGVSNHMGSNATENSALMEIVFKELKKRRLYFLDSFVTSKSVCADLAKKTGIGFAKRDVFLDNKNDPEYIRAQIYKLKVKAKTNGQAVGIGHDRPNTLEVLRQVMPELEKEGYRFVVLSELAQ